MVKAHWTSHFKGARKQPGQMNKAEAAYAAHLELRKAAGEILWYAYEPFSLRLADGAWYKPDFGVMLADGEIECHEVKGHWDTAARVRIKVAADKYPFRFVAMQRRAKKDGGGYAVEEF